MNLLFNLLLFGFLSATVGCVGTVQEAAVPKTAIASQPRASISFDGLFKADPVSQDKFELFFKPAKGGSGKYNYIIYVGDNPFPITVPTEVLQEDYEGYLKYTVKGFDTGKSYDIKVEAEDQLTGGKDSNEVVINATTFFNAVADFPGIASLSSTAGIEGLDSIKVRWSHASLSGSIVLTATDPVSYEIVALDSTNSGLTPANFDDLDKKPVDGRFVKSVLYDSDINEVTLRGLKPNTKYYVRVRAIHSASSFIHGPDPRKRSELNSKYMWIKTLDDDLSKIKFKVSGLAVSLNDGMAQSSSLVLTWPIASGVFDHFRVYYSQVESNLGTPSSACVINYPPKDPPDPNDPNALDKTYSVSGCKKYAFDSTGSIIPTLQANKDYYFRLVVCQLEDCSRNIMGVPRKGTTVPIPAPFNGLSDIRGAEKISEIGKIFLTFSPADFSQGDFDGYHVKYRSDTSLPKKEIITDPTDINSLNLRYEAFDFRTANSITITNVDYGAGGTYCFTVIPFIYDDNPLNMKGYKTLDNDVEKCLKPELKVPDATQFKGLEALNGAEVEGHDIVLSWTQPLAGIFDSYRVFILNPEAKRNGATFSYETAREEISNGIYSNYTPLLIQGGLDTYRLRNLPNGEYQIGILTYFAFIPLAGQGEIYESEDNEGVYTCSVNENGTGSDCTLGLN